MQPSRTEAVPDRPKPASQDARDVLIFLHIPKAGGTTLEHLIRRQYPAESVLWISFDRPELLSRFQALDEESRSNLRCLMGHVPFGIDSQLPGHPVYITILRDPVARFISEYGQVQRVKRHGAWRPPVDMLESMTLEDFLDYRIENNSLNAQTRFIGGFVPPSGSKPPFDPLPPDALETAKFNLENRFAVVGITDRFDESLLLMKKRLGWKRHLFYARQNTAPRPISTSNIAPETLRRIEEHTRLDAELVTLAGELLTDAIRREGNDFQDEVRTLRRVNHSIYLLSRTWKRSPKWFRDAPGLRHVRALGHRLLG